MTNRRTLSESFSTRVARARHGASKNRILRAVGGRGAATLLLGTALSIGGIAETLDNVHFLVQKDLDTVRVVRQHGAAETVLASMGGGFAGNTIFKLSQVLPDTMVTRELALFDNRWISLDEPAEGNAPRSRGIFFKEMNKINDAIRAEFFATAMPFGELIHEKSRKYDVDPALVAAVIEQESRFKVRARSHVGAKGLMQLMPRTGRWMGARDLYDPEQNIDAGVKYIKYLDKRFDGNVKLTIAAYNGGEGNVKKYRGVPPFRETRTYVKKVMNNYEKRNKQLEAFEKQHSGGSISEADTTLALR